jgi:hypothetical protein
MNKRKPAQVPEGHRRCAACRETLPLASFSRDTGRPSGLRYSCRRCDNAARVTRQERTFWTPQRIEASRKRLAQIIRRVEARQAEAAADSAAFPPAYPSTERTFAHA